MYRSRLLLLLLSSLTFSSSFAAPLYVTTSGIFSSTDVAGPLVAPNAAFALTFTVDSNPVPLAGTVTSLGFDVSVSNFSYRLAGASINAVPSEIRFNTLANGGLFDITFGSGLAASAFSFQGAQIFSGSVNNPVFAIGNYAVSTWTFSDPSNFDVRTPTGLFASVTPVPEPSSFALLLGGSLLVLFGCLRVKKNSSKSTL